jgi:hypothetical protein
VLTAWLIWLWQCLGYDVRGIFVFWDGRRWKRADPMVALQRLYEIPDFNPDETPLMLSAADPHVRMKTAAHIASAVQTAFGLRTLADGGLTILESVSLLASFDEYMTGLKKSTGLEPTSPTPMEPPVSAESATKNESDSGSTSIEPQTAQPGA